MSDKSIQVHSIIEGAITALMDIGATRKTALHLMASQAIFAMDDLEQLRQIRQDVNSTIIINDNSISEDTCVIIDPCDCIIPEPKRAASRRD